MTNGEGWRTVTLADVLTPVRRLVSIDDDRSYDQVTVRIKGRGLVSRGVVPGSAIAADTQYEVRAGDFLVSKIDARNGGLGFVPDSLEGAVVSSDFPAYSVYEQLCRSDYLDLYTRRSPFWEECLLLSEGSTNRVRLVPEEFLKLEMELPSLADQAAAVRAVARVDGVSAAAEDLASAADAAFRAASLDLFDALEADWARLGDVTRLTSGGTPSRKVASNFGGDIPWAKTGEVRFNRLSDTEEHITESGLAGSSAKLLPPGTVLLAMYGQGATRGRCAILDREMATNQACAAILPTECLLPEFIFFFLWSRYEAIRAESEGSAQDNLNQGQVADIELPVPPLHHQERIVKVLSALRGVVEARQRESRAASTFRRALVEDLVTGVRRPPTSGNGA